MLLAIIIRCKAYCDIKQIEDTGFGQAVEHIPAVLSVLNQSRFPQDGKLLRNVCLTKAKMGFHMADALLATAQDVDDRQAGRMSQHFDKLSLVFISIKETSGMVNHIRFSEYDLSTK